MPYATGDGLRLRYDECGSAHTAGPPIVLLHGITSSAAAWQPVATQLALHRRVLAFDARGHGGSDWSPDEDYAADSHFADLAAALDGLAIERCTLVGYSMGGAVAIMYAAALPERTESVVVVDAYPDAEMSAGSRRIAEFIAALYDGALTGLPRGFDPTIARRLRDDLAAGAANRLDLWPFWEALTVPVLLVRGGLSDVLTSSVAEEMVRRQPRCRLVTVPDVGHQVPLLRPHELASAVLTHAGVRPVQYIPSQMVRTNCS